MRSQPMPEISTGQPFKAFPPIRAKADASEVRPGLRDVQRLAHPFAKYKESSMAVKTVKFSVDVPDDVSDEDIEAWVSFELHALGSLSAANPLAHKDLRAEYGSVFVD